MRYIIFVIDLPNNRATQTEMTAINAFNQMLRDNQHWISAAGISQSEHSKIIDNREGLANITKGSIVEGSENYSGFWLVNVQSDAEAEKLGLAASLACNRRVEMRPYL